MGDPMQALVALRAQHAAPIGPNQGIGAPQLGAPPAKDPHTETNGNQQDVLASFGNRAIGGGDSAKLAHHLGEIGRTFPKLALAANNNGMAELIGPAQQQFLAAAYARAHGASVAHVRNRGKGQRLHLRWD